MISYIPRSKEFGGDTYEVHTNNETRYFSSSAQAVLANYALNSYPAETLSDSLNNLMSINSKDLIETLLKDAQNASIEVSQSALKYNLSLWLNK